MSAHQLDYVTSDFLRPRAAATAHCSCGIRSVASGRTLAVLSLQHAHLVALGVVLALAGAPGPVDGHFALTHEPEVQP